MDFPLSTADFIDLLPVQDTSFHIERRLAQTGLNSGEVITAEMARPRWRGYVNLAPMREDDAGHIEALFDALSAPDASFMIYRRPRLGPRSDPNGAALDATSPVISARSVEDSTIRISGLPASFAIAAGDLIQLDRGVGAAPALHRFLTTATATGAGSFATDLEITPRLDPDTAAIASAVVMVRPAIRAVLVPGSVSFGQVRNRLGQGLGFEFRQTFR